MMDRRGDEDGKQDAAEALLLQEKIKENLQRQQDLLGRLAESSDRRYSLLSASSTSNAASVSATASFLASQTVLKSRENKYTTSSTSFRPASITPSPHSYRSRSSIDRTELAQLSEREPVVRNLRQQVSTLLQSRDEEIDGLRRQIKTLEETNHTLRLKSEQTEASLRACEEREEQQSALIKRQREMLSVAQTAATEVHQLRVSTDHLPRLCAELEELKRELEEAKFDLEEKKSKVLYLTNEAEHYRTTWQTTAKDLEVTKDRVLDLVNIFDTTTDQVIEHLKVMDDEIRDVLTGKEPAENPHSPELQVKAVNDVLLSLGESLRISLTELASLRHQSQLAAEASHETIYTLTLKKNEIENLSNELEDVRSAHKAESEELKEERHSLLQVLRRIQDENNAIKSENDSQNASIEQLQREIEDLKTKNDNDINQTLQRHSATLEELKTRHEFVISCLKDQHNQDLENEAERSERELLALRQQHEQAMQDLQAAADQDIQDLRAQHLRAQQELQENYNRNMEDMRSQHTRDFLQLQHSSCNELMTTRLQANQTRDELERQLELLRSDLQVKLENEKYQTDQLKQLLDEAQNALMETTSSSSLTIANLRSQLEECAETLQAREERLRESEIHGQNMETSMVQTVNTMQDSISRLRIACALLVRALKPLRIRYKDLVVQKMMLFSWCQQQERMQEDLHNLICNLMNSAAPELRLFQKRTRHASFRVAAIAIIAFNRIRSLRQDSFHYGVSVRVEEQRVLIADASIVGVIPSTLLLPDEQDRQATAETLVDLLKGADTTLAQEHSSPSWLIVQLAHGHSGFQRRLLQIRAQSIEDAYGGSRWMSLMRKGFFALAGKLTEHQDLNRSLRLRSSTLSDEVDNNKMQMAMLQQSLTNFQQLADQYQSRLAEAQLQVQSMVSLDKFQSLLEDQETTVANYLLMQAERDTLKKELDTRVWRIEELTERVSSLQTELENTQQEADQTQRQLKEKTKEAEGLYDYVNHKTEQIAQLEDDNSKRLQELVQEQGAHRTTMLDMQQLDARVKELTQELEECHSRVTTYSKQISTLQHRAEDAENQKILMQSDLRTKLQELTQCKEIIRSIKESYSISHAHTLELERQLTDLAENTHHLRANILDTIDRSIPVSCLIPNDINVITTSHSHHSSPTVAQLINRPATLSASSTAVSSTNTPPRSPHPPAAHNHSPSHSSLASSPHHHHHYHHAKPPLTTAGLSDLNAFVAAHAPAPSHSDIDSFLNKIDSKLLRNYGTPPSRRIVSSLNQDRVWNSMMHQNATNGSP